MAFVLDASAAVAPALGETDPRALAAKDRLRDGDDALVPGLWWFELRNALVINERRGRLTQNETARFPRDLSQLAITVDHLPNEASLMSLARRYRLTVYDAAYLELAQRQGVPLATLDGALAAAATAENVPLPA